MSCVATYRTGQSSISEKPRIPEARFPRRTLLGFSGNRGSPPLRFAEDRGLTLVRRLLTIKEEPGWTAG